MFKKYFNITLSAYFNKQKIYYAHTLIQSTDLSIEQICNLIGFSGLSYFYRLFGQYYPHPPASYRKRMRPMSRLLFKAYVRPNIVDIWMRDSPQRLVGKVYTRFSDKFMRSQMDMVVFPTLERLET